MEQIILKWLRPEQFRILKQIVILGDRSGVEIELGRIFYKRTFSNGYNLKKQGIEDKKNENSMAKFLNEYPKQENYPVDKVDVMIFEAVRLQFPKSITRSDTMFHDLDVEKLEKFKSRNVIPSLMYFYPDLSDAEDIYLMSETTRNGFKANVNIYSYSNPEILQHQIFHAMFALEDRHIEHNLKSVEFE